MNKPNYVWTMWSQDNFNDKPELDWVFGLAQPSVEDVEKALKQEFGYADQCNKGASIRWIKHAAKLRATNKLEAMVEPYENYSVWLVKLELGKPVDIREELV